MTLGANSRWAKTYFIKVVHVQEDENDTNDELFYFITRESKEK